MGKKGQIGLAGILFGALLGCSTPGKGVPDDPLLQGRNPIKGKFQDAVAPALAFSEPPLLIDPTTKRPLETKLARPSFDKPVQGVLTNRPKLPD